MRHLRNFLNTLGTIIIESYHLTSSPLTSDKNALLTEQRAEVLPNIIRLETAPFIYVRMTQYARINCLLFAHLLH